MKLGIDFRLRIHSNIIKTLDVHSVKLEKLICSVMFTLKNKSVLEKKNSLFWRKTSDFTGDESARLKKVQPCHRGKWAFSSMVGWIRIAYGFIRNARDIY